MSSTILSLPPIKIALIGAGLIGPRHALSILKYPTLYTLIAIVDPSPSVSATASSLSCSYYPSISLLLASHEKPDAAIICTPNSTHVALATELASAGIHILVEKPIATDIASGKALIAHAQKCGVHLLVGHHRRFNPYIMSTKASVSSQSLGTILAISGTWTTLKPPTYYLPPTEWRQSSSAGTIFINMIHEIDILQFLLGPIVRVSADAIPKTRGYEADEGAAILLRFASGVVGTFLCSDAVPSPWNFEAGTGENPMIPFIASDSGAGGFYRIFGSKGSLSVPDMTLWSYPSPGGGGLPGDWTQNLQSTCLKVDREIIPFDLQMQHFAALIRGDVEEPMCSGEEGLSALVVCEAVVEALKTGEAVNVEL